MPPPWSRPASTSWRGSPPCSTTPTPRHGSIACVGAGTALLAATIACAQDDIKKALAYSTISQLGYMFLAVGAGDYVDGVFHMLTHAFFKALLFLAAGAVIHALADHQNMKEMGGLRKYLPITAITFGVGWLAISGIPPLAGFWSKDAVLSSAWQMNKVLWVIGVFTAGLTAYYMSRQFALVFTGQARWEEARPAAVASHEHHEAEGHGTVEGHEGTGPGLPAPAHAEARPKDPTWTMSVPLMVLAIAAVLGGGINFPAWHMDFLTRFLSPLFPAAHVCHHKHRHQVGAFPADHRCGSNRSRPGAVHLEDSRAPPARAEFPAPGLVLRRPRVGYGFRAAAPGRLRAGLRHGQEGRRRRWSTGPPAPWRLPAACCAIYKMATSGLTPWASA